MPIYRVKTAAYAHEWAAAPLPAHGAMANLSHRFRLGKGNRNRPAQASAGYFAMRLCNHVILPSVQHWQGK